MARRKKSAAARRGKSVKRGKAPRRVEAQRKAAKRGATKAKSRTVPTKAKARRPVAKIPASRKGVPQKPQEELPIEVVKVETIEEPAPGVVVVKEYGSVRVRRPKVTAEAGKPQESAGIPDSNDK
jgi:hypothetical protein